MCPRCGTRLRFYDNIPVLSYVWLRGRCRSCGGRISLRYPVVEIAAGLLAFCTYLKFGLSLEALIYYVFVAALLVVAYIDLDHRIIPDTITLPGIPLAFLATFLLSGITWRDALLGLLAGGGSLYIVAVVYRLLTRKEGMGGGDIKLLAMIGALVGWKGVLFTIFLASGVGSVTGALIMVRSKKNMKMAIPFGPFLSIAAIAYIYFGPQLISRYLNLFN